MSIEKMISEHPQVGANYNQALGRAVKHAIDCGAICNSCADACSAEDMDMRRCIRVCLDCSDVCEATYRVASRRTDHNRQLIRTMLATCILACQICEEECARHAMAYCRRCAQMCRECAEDCLKALESLNDEVHADA